MSSRALWYIAFVTLALLSSPLARPSQAQGVPLPGPTNPPAPNTSAPQGAYAFTGMESCVEQVGETPGFQDVNGQVTLIDDGFTYNGTISGTMQFSDNGRLTISNAQSTSIISDQITANAAPIYLGRTLTLSCDGTHTTNDSGNNIVTATCNLSIPDGPTLTVTPYTLHGTVGTSTNTLILTNNGTIENLTITRTDGSQANAQRLCTRSLSGHSLSTSGQPGSSSPDGGS